MEESFLFQKHFYGSRAVLLSFIGANLLRPLLKAFRSCDKFFIGFHTYNLFVKVGVVLQLVLKISAVLWKSSRSDLARKVFYG